MGPYAQIRGHTTASGKKRREYNSEYPKPYKTHSSASRGFGLNDSSEGNEHEETHGHPVFLGSGSRLRFGQGATAPRLDCQEPHKANERRRTYGSSWRGPERPAPLRNGI